jgi:hypothetical protein
MEDDDRTEWDAAWGAMPHRRMLRWRPGLEDQLGLGFGEIVTVSISPTPEQYIGTMYVSTTACPICGLTTDDTERLAVSLHPVFTRSSGFGLSGWAHKECFESCPLIDEPPRIPW